MREVQSVVSAIRAVRGQFSIHPAEALKVTVNADSKRFGQMVPQLESLARSTITFSSARPKTCATALAGALEIFVDLEGLVDPVVERDRLVKKIAKVEQTLQGIRTRLANEEFVRSAPEKIVNGAKEQLSSNEKELSVLKESLKAFE